MQGGFVISDIFFLCDDPTHNPSSVQILSLFTQFSGLTAQLSLVLGKVLQGGAWLNLVLSFRSDDLTRNPSFSNTNFARGLCQS